LRLQLEQRRDAIQKRIAEQIAAAQRVEEFRAASKSGKCPVCAHSVEPTEMARLAAAAGKDADTDIAAAQTEVVRVQQELDTLAGLASGDELARVTDLFEDLEDARVKLHSQKSRLRELTEEIAEHNEAAYRLQRKEFEHTLGQIQILQRGVDAQAAEVAKTEAQLRDSRKQLDRISGAGLAGERRKREMFVALADLFREAVAVYRNRLRGRVEKDATELFLKLTSEPDDAGLRINDQYGLTIVHKDGTDIVVRSSGAEQIVALSLMGALQKNAPLRGPIIADSLLMRVDDTHRANLVRALPSMSEQVVVLVFRAELRPQDARHLLNGNLLAEYELSRVSAKHTRIEPYKGKA
jgi:DNA repair exonuclease SbcCD ATPase subunit